MIPLKKGQPREEDRYMWGCGRSPHPHIYPFPLLEGSFFSALIFEKGNLDVHETANAALSRWLDFV